VEKKMSNGNGRQNLGEVAGIWAALLDFATHVGSTDMVNQTPSSFHEMSLQDREFLTSAMAGYMKESDPVRQLKDNLDILMNLEFKTPNDEQKAQGIASLDHIIELCISLDLATDFHKLGGFRILVPLLASGAQEFRAQGGQLIGELAQNHPYCQKALHKANVLGVLLQLVDSDPDPTVKTKALFAVSCLIRNNEELERDFVKMDGFSFLLRATMSDCERLSTKASFYYRAS
jgi:hsp70-interacting protein